MGSYKTILIVMIILVVLVFVGVSVYFTIKKKQEALYINDPEELETEYHPFHTGYGTYLTGVDAIDDIIVNAPTFTKRNQCKKYGRRACKSVYGWMGKDYKTCKRAVLAALCTM